MSPGGPYRGQRGTLPCTSHGTIRYPVDWANLRATATTLGEGAVRGELMTG
jgi:hypothetical protein